MKRSTAVSVGAIVASFVASIALFPRLPQEMAVHWNAAGKADSFSSRLVGAFLLPVVTLVVYGAFLAIPRIDPLGENIEQFRSAFDWFVGLLVAFLAYVHGVVLLTNLGYGFDVSRAVLPAVGFLLIASGFVVERAERNWFVGIRTPWTLSSDEVWERTHRIGGKLFKISGVIALLGVFAGEYAVYFVVGPAFATALVTTAYSYYAYRQLDNGTGVTA